MLVQKTILYFRNNRKEEARKPMKNAALRKEKATKDISHATKTGRRGERVGRGGVN